MTVVISSPPNITIFRPHFICASSFQFRYYWRNARTDTCLLFWLQIPFRSCAFKLVQLAASCCELSDLENIGCRFGPACTQFLSELQDITTELLKGNSERQLALSIIFSALQPSWLVTRLADHLISRYDVSCLQGESRMMLAKPLSYEKVVNIHFFCLHHWFVYVCCTLNVTIFISLRVVYFSRCTRRLQKEHTTITIGAHDDYKILLPKYQYEIWTISMSRSW